MLILSYISIALLLIYLSIILTYYYGWNKIQEYNQDNNDLNISVSVIVAFRNEENNLPQLIECLKNQSHQNKIEFLFVNDHSTDMSVKKIKPIISGLNNFRLLELPQNKTGKKEAIKYAIENTEGELIVTTDADCHMGNNWLNIIVSYYEKNRPLLISAPVLIEKQNNWFSNFQSIELLSLVGSGAGAIRVKKPIMCNGANMAFARDFYTKSTDLSNKKYVSGDDVFLLLAAKKVDNEKVHFIKSKEASVYTKALPALNDYLNQHLRWISKGSGYRDFDVLFVAFSVYFMNAILLILAITSFFKLELLLLLLVTLFLKSAIDAIFLNKLSKFFFNKYLGSLFKLHQLVNILINALLPIASLLFSFKWKGRKYKTGKY